MKNILTKLENWLKQQGINLTKMLPETFAIYLSNFGKTVWKRATINHIIKALKFAKIIKDIEELPMSRLEEYSSKEIKRLDEYLDCVAGNLDPYEKDDPDKLEKPNKQKKLDESTVNSKRKFVLKVWDRCCERLDIKREEFHRGLLEKGDLMKASSTGHHQFWTTILGYLAFESNRTDNSRTERRRFIKIHKELLKEDREYNPKSEHKHYSLCPLEIVQGEKAICKLVTAMIKPAILVAYRFEIYVELREGEIVKIILNDIVKLEGEETKCGIKGGFPITKSSCVDSDKYGGAWVIVRKKINKTNHENRLIYLIPRVVDVINELLQSNGMQGAPANAYLIPRNGKWTTEPVQDDWFNGILTRYEDKLNQVWEYHKGRKITTHSLRKSGNVMYKTGLQLTDWIDPGMYQDYHGRWARGKNDDDPNGSAVRKECYEDPVFLESYAKSLRESFDFPNDEEGCKRDMEKKGYDMTTGKPPVKKNLKKNQNSEKEDMIPKEKTIVKETVNSEPVVATNSEFSDEDKLKNYRNMVAQGLMKEKEALPMIKELEKRLAKKQNVSMKQDQTGGAK